MIILRCDLMFSSHARKLRRFSATLILVIALLVIILIAENRWSTSGKNPAGFQNHKVRIRREVVTEFDDCKPKISPAISSNSSSSQFPHDFMSLATKRRGGIAIHVALLIYMFVALAIVCDEFFVPSLSVITEVLSISDDVAGATFMAAGGSAPEFFTSLFGVFIAQNNVGVGTIVGSATFNILCVLAFCTLFSRQVLNLTWWPLFRDISFYTVSLLILLLFFADEEIEWYEALFMFTLYIFYGIFMKFNTSLERQVKRLLNFGMGSADAAPISHAGCTPRGLQELGAVGSRRSIPMIHGGQEVRKSIAQLVMGDEDDSTTSTASSSPTIQASVAVIPGIRDHPPPKANGRTVTVKPVDADDSDDIFIKTNNIRTVTTFLETMPENEINPSNNGNIENGCSPVIVPPIELENLSTSSSNDEQPLDLTWPDSMNKRILYILLAPITFPLAYTLPDVRNPHIRKFFAITFIGSICWIATYSYLMVWWANTIGETFGIPTEIMGLTILAAGTSIPDLITSVIVARKGLGDMAVSSSIGSNLFDVCVGLPIPWLLHFLIGAFKSGGAENISVTSNGLACSIGLLFAMLIVLLICVAITRWKMDKYFGILMIFSYAAFCMLCIFLETGHLNCPLRNSC